MNQSYYCNFKSNICKIMIQKIKSIIGLKIEAIILLFFRYLNDQSPTPSILLNSIRLSLSAMVTPNGMILFLGLKISIIDTIQINEYITLDYFVKVLPTLARRNRQSLVSRFVIGNLVSLGIELKILIKILSNTPKS